jgi:hypothetical protein
VDHWYNFTVQAAGGGLVMENLNFQIQSYPSGNVTSLAGWTLNVIGLTATVVATYSMVAGTWSTGPTVAFSGSMVISLLTQTSMSGNTFVVSLSYGACPGGTVTTPIP